MSKFLVGVAAGLAVGMTVTLGGMSLFRADSPATENLQSPAEYGSSSQLTPELEIDRAYGSLISKLQSEEGFYLDHYSLSFMIVSNQQYTGLLRTIGNSQANIDIRQFATESIKKINGETDRLLLLQKSLGHSHH